MCGCNMLQMIWDMRHELTNTFFLSCPSESSSTSLSCPSGPAHVTLPRWMYRRANRLAVLLRFVMCAARVNFFPVHSFLFCAMRENVACECLFVDAQMCDYDKRCARNAHWEPAKKPQPVINGRCRAYNSACAQWCSMIVAAASHRQPVPIQQTQP